jgi:hypothetical protein
LTSVAIDPPPRRNASYREIRRLTVVAFLTVEHVAEMAGAALRRSNPRSVRPWWLMAKMLVVSALEFGHPVQLFVLLIADNAFLHVVLLIAPNAEVIGLQTTSAAPLFASPCSPRGWVSWEIL